MRKPSFVNSFKTALVVAPLLASCGGTVNSSPMVIVNPSGLALPDCQDGQLVGVNPDQTLTCISASSMLTPPNCMPGTQALTSMTDTVTGTNVLSCVVKGTGMNDVTTSTRITTAQTNITNLQNSVSMITTGGGTRGKYIGMSNTASVGQVFSGGTTFQGARAADLVCSNDLGVDGAHMCSPFEIYESLVTGSTLLQQGTPVGPLMVYMEAWVYPFQAMTAEDTAGLNENCGAHSYMTADRHWHNTFFTWNKPPGNANAPYVAQFDSTHTCNETAKFACCK